MGDVVSLVERAQETIDADQARALEKKMRKATFDLEDFLDQIQSLRGMGSLGELMDMIPGFGAAGRKMAAAGGGDVIESRLKRAEAIVRSMTPSERRRPEIINGSRRRRIAAGSGTTPRDVNSLLNEFMQARKVMKRHVLREGTTQPGRIDALDPGSPSRSPFGRPPA